MKARDPFQSLARASLAAVFLLLGPGAAQAATPNITGTGAAPDILDTQTSRPFENAQVTDGDNDDVVLTINFPATHGTFPTNLTFSRSGSVYTLTRRSPDAVTDFITNLVFTPALNSIDIGMSRTTRFILTVTDTNGLERTDNQTTLEVTPVNDRPTIAGIGGPFAIGDNQTNRPFATVEIADVDNLGGQPITLTVIIDKPVQGNFTNGTQSIFALSSSNRYTFNGTPAEATAAIQNLQFKPRENRLPVGSSETTIFTVLVADDGSPSLSTNASTQVTATSINDPPQIGGATATAQPVRTGSSIAAFANVFISDPDVNTDPLRNGQSQTVTVTLQGANVVGEWNPPGGQAKTFTLGNVTPAEATAAIQTLLYSAPVFPLPFNTTNRMTASIVVTDSSLGSGTNLVTTIEVFSPFTPPGLSGTQTDQRVNDNSTIAPFSTVSIQSLNGGFFAVLVQLDNDEKGQLINLSGFVKTAGPRARYVFTGGSEAATLAIRQLLFRPTENRLSGSVTERTIFEISLIDGGTTNGPDASTTVIVSPVNDRPLIQGTPSSPIFITDNQTTQPFRTVAISDVDERSTQSVHLVITLDDAAKGSFLSNSFGGFVASGGGYTFDGAGADATRALRGLVFAPAENRVPIGESETTVFTLDANDGHGGSAVDSRTAVRVLSVAGAPEILVPTPQPISRPLASPLFPFEAVRITDEEELTVTVALLIPNQGVFTTNSLALTGFTNSGPGAFTLHGSVDVISNAITQLDFVPNASLPPGAIITFSITAVDTTGNTVTETLSILLRATQRVFVVTKTGDYAEGVTDPDIVLGTLRKAVEDAGSNDRITFNLRPPSDNVPDLPATIRLLRTIALSKNVTIDGPGANQLTISGDVDDNGTPDVQLFLVTAQARLHGLTLAKGSAGFAGGAVSVRPGGSLHISYCTVTECQAEQWGGGIDVEGGGFQMDHCLISSNRTVAAVGQGGGGISIYSDQNFVIENTTFSGNHQQSPGGLGGGGLYLENFDAGSPMVIEINGCTFRDNKDEAFGGTSIRPNVFNTLALLKNTIVADGRGENLEADDSGLFLSMGGNLSDDSTLTIFSFGGEPYEVVIFEPPADQTNIVPRVGPLALNAGSTRTHALAVDSPAVAAAVTNTLGTDQRGYWRENPVDSGAYETGQRRQIIINEIAFDPPAPGVNDEFIEFYVPRAATTNLNVAGLQVWIGGVLRHTFTAQTLGPGQGLVLFSRDASSTAVPAGVFSQVATTNLLLDNNGDTIVVRNPQAQIVLDVSYVGMFTSSDPSATNRFGPNQSLTRVPEFTGVFLPFQAAYEKITGLAPNPAIVSSPGAEVGGRSLAGGNAPPIAFDDFVETDEDTALTIEVLANDLEQDGADILRIVNSPASSVLGATLTATATNITYDPSGSAALRSLPEGSNRVDVFTYTLIDCCDPSTGADWPVSLGGRYTATNFITVLGVNDAPTPQLDSLANNPRLRTLEDRSLEIRVVTDLLPNDTDPDTDDDNTTLEIAAIHGTATPEDTFEAFSQLGALVTLELRFNRNETRITYDPTGSEILNALEQGQTTNDVFYYSLIDRHGAIGVAEVRIQVTGTNDLPTATADALATDEDTILAVPVLTLLGNDTDPDTDDDQTTLNTLQLVEVNGAISLVSTTGFGARVEVAGANLRYDPVVSTTLRALARKETVVDSFTYTTSDNFGGRSTTTVSVTVVGVNDQPITAPDTGAVSEDTVALVSAPGVLANDIDFDINGEAPDDRLRVLAATNAPTAQGALYSIHADGSYEFDPRGTFDYLKQDQTTNDTFSYTVVDDSYTVANDDEFSVLADSENVSLAVLANDVTLTGTGGALRIVSVGPTSNGGTVAINPAGTALIYNPQINFVGVETFQYGIEDGQGGHDTASVRVKATRAVLNGNLAANADRFTVARGTSATLNLLANDNIVPASGDVLSIVELGPTDQGGLVTLLGAGPNNVVSFTPSSNAVVFPYTETFRYSVSGGGVALATGIVAVTVVNRAGILPVNDDVFTVIAGESTSPLDVLANDRVVPGTTTNLFITGIETNGVSGIVTVDPAGTRLLYTPPVGSVSHVEPVFRYAFSDGSGGTATGQVMVTVMEMGLNANDDFVTVARNSTNTLFVLANDNALPNVGQNLLITTIGLSNNLPSQGGKATIGANGRSIVYAPSPTNLTGAETFTYEITDGTLARVQGRVRVRIVDRQGAVNANADAFSVSRDTTNNLLRVLANDNILPDTRERLTITALGAPNRGGFVRLVGTTPNQAVLYSPANGYVGDEDFTYAVADNRGGTGLASVRVHVGHLIAHQDFFTALSESADNVLDVLYNDRLLPNGTPNRRVVALSSTNPITPVTIGGGGNFVLYSPAANFTGREAFLYRVADDSGNEYAGQALVTVLPQGGDRSTTTVTTTVIGTNDAPVISGTTAGQQITDKETIRPFIGVTLVDVDEYGVQPLTITVSLDDAAKGLLRNLSGFVSGSAGTYTFNGTPAAATAAIRELVFDPTENRITVPTTEITRFTIQANDGFVASPVTDDVTTVAVTAVNDPPVISGTVASQRVYHRLSLRPFASTVITEVDDLTLQSLRVSVTLSDATHGFLTALGPFVNAGGGVYRLNGVTAAQSTAALRALVFQPTTNGRVTPGAPETTTFTLSVDDSFAPPVVDNNTSVLAIHEFVAKLLASDGSTGDAFANAVAASRDVVVVGAPLDDDRGNASGAAYIYVRNPLFPETWTQFQKLVPADGQSADQFGLAVAISGNTIVIGAPFARLPQSSGAAYLFTRTGTNAWTQSRKLTPADAANGDEFGISVSVDADTVAVGSRADDDLGTSSGSVYVFGRDQGGTNNWGFTRKVLPPDGAAGDQFGFSVSVNSGVLLAGAPFDVAGASATGSAYLFSRHQGGSNNWGQILKLIPSDGVAGDEFGNSVSLNGTAAVVGSRRNDQSGNDTGAAYVYSRDQGGSNTWGQVRKLLSPDSLNNDQFGYSVSISGDKIVVGMPFSGVDNQSKWGSAYLFVRDFGGTNQWGLVQKLDRVDIENNDQFGWSVAIGQNTVVVGTPMDDDRGGDSGSAYVYRVKYNNRPALGISIPDAVAIVGSSFILVLPPVTFGDPDIPDVVTLSAAAAAGPLPAWLAFDPATGTFTGTPPAPGSFIIVVTATDEDGASTTDSFELVVTAGIAMSPLALWQVNHFGASAGRPLEEPTLWGNSADPDQDGYSNLLEYMCGTDPLTSTPDTDFLRITRGNLAGEVLIEFPRRTSDTTCTLLLESSSDLISWGPASVRGLGERSSPLSTDIERVTVRLDAGTLPGEYFRLSVR